MLWAVISTANHNNTKKFGFLKCKFDDQEPLFVYSKSDCLTLKNYYLR